MPVGTPVGILVGRDGRLEGWLDGRSDGCPVGRLEGTPEGR
jgi:hypothetical protein